jgi:hypothetical protein
MRTAPGFELVVLLVRQHSAQSRQTTTRNRAGAKAGGKKLGQGLHVASREPGGKGRGRANLGKQFQPGLANQKWPRSLLTLAEAQPASVANFPSCDNEIMLRGSRSYERYSHERYFSEILARSQLARNGSPCASGNARFGQRRPRNKKRRGTRGAARSGFGAGSGTSTRKSFGFMRAATESQDVSPRNSDAPENASSPRVDDRRPHQHPADPARLKITTVVLARPIPFQLNSKVPMPLIFHGRC